MSTPLSECLNCGSVWSPSQAIDEDQDMDDEYLDDDDDYFPDGSLGY